MARTTTAKAGEYELLHSEYHEYDKDEKGRDRDHIATYTKGDIVTLTAEQAERLTTGDLPAFAKPGTLQQAEADRLQALADSLKAQADDAKARAAEAAKARTQSGKAPTGSGDEKPAGNASLDEWRAYALANGATEADLEGKTRDEVRDSFTS